MTKKNSVGIAGNPGSGKTSVAQYLCDKYGYCTLEGSDYLRQKAKEQNITLTTREDFSAFHRQLQEEYGTTVISDYILGLPYDKVAFVGLRSGYNAQKIQDSGGVIIFLDAPQATRYERKKSQNGFSIESFEDFKLQEERQLNSLDHLGADLESVINQADYIVNASVPLAEVYKAIDHIIHQK
jgi:dephospho-CoA kinase